jgi:hypothetical protein
MGVSNFRLLDQDFSIILYFISGIVTGSAYKTNDFLKSPCFAAKLKTTIDNKHRYAMSSEAIKAVDQVITAFFDMLDTRDGKKPDLSQLRQYFVDDAVLSKRYTDGTLELQSFDDFVTPWQPLLTDGTLVNFHEWQTTTQTTVNNDVATQLSQYAKEGLYNGQPFSAAGDQHCQLVRMEDGWKILSILWQDFPQN